MTDNTVKLPELPQPAHPTHSIGPLWNAKQMQDYATAAVMADRAERSQWTKQKPPNPGLPLHLLEARHAIPQG